MNVPARLRELRGRASEVRPLLAALAVRHRFWLESAGITLLALLVLTAFGLVALRRAASWEEQIRALRQVEASMVSANSRFEPADTAEIGYWEASGATLTRLAAQASDPLTVAGVIAQRSEEVGVPSLRVRLDAEAGGGALGAIQAGEWRAEPQTTAIVADFPGGASVLARFVGVLPPHVEVVSVSVTASGGGSRNEVRMIVRQVEGGG